MDTLTDRGEMLCDPIFCTVSSKLAGSAAQTMLDPSTERKTLVFADAVNLKNSSIWPIGDASILILHQIRLQPASERSSMTGAARVGLTARVGTRVATSSKKGLAKVPHRLLLEKI